MLISQNAINLMTDRVAPLKHRGFAQGFNTTLQNTYIELASFAIEVLSHAEGVATAIFTVASIDFWGSPSRSHSFYGTTTDSRTSTMTSKNALVIQKASLYLH